MEEELLHCCIFGNFDNIKNILNNNPNINIHYRNEKIFRHICYYGYLEIAQWLIEKYPDIDIHVLNEWAFRYACINGKRSNQSSGSLKMYENL